MDLLNFKEDKPAFMSTRRAFIKSGAIAAFGIGFGGVPAFIVNAAAQLKHNRLNKKNKILICIFQRGAMDGLMAVCPFKDEFLKMARPSIFMTASKENNKSPLIDLDGTFGLHPAMSAFEPLFRNKQLAIVHGMGSPNKSRSHFDAQDYMETGFPFEKGSESGWLNRLANVLPNKATPFRAVSMTASMPRSFYGDYPSIAISNLKDFTLRGNALSTRMNLSAKSFEDLYDETTNQLLKETGKETFEAIEMLKKADIQNYQPSNGVVYPNTALGNAMKQLCQLIKADVGLEIGFAESTGWDTHFNQGTATGNFAKSADDLSRSIAAFWNDLGSEGQDQVTIMTMTEFGRTVKQNGSGGTDHGRGSCSFIIGNDLNGGEVFGKIPVLSPDNLEDYRDLPITTDFRSVFTEVAIQHLNVGKDARLFGDLKTDFLGIMR